MAHVMCLLPLLDALCASARLDQSGPDIQAYGCSVQRVLLAAAAGPPGCILISASAVEAAFMYG